MKSWPIQDAKNQLSRVIELARTKGPQTITKHGEPIVVMMTVDHYKKIAPQRPSPLEFFSRLRGSGLKIERRNDLPRKIKL
jgi:antitoxin Phd